MTREIRRAPAGVQPLTTSQHPPALNWSVMWVKGDRIIEKWCDDDFSEALRVLDLATKAGKTGVTLRCANHAFPPPEKYRDKMEQVNKRGIFWCGHCIKFRRFEKQSGFYVEDTDIFVPKETLFCPLCGVTVRQVARFNPLAHQISERRRVRRSSGKRRRRKAA